MLNLNLPRVPSQILISFCRSAAFLSLALLLLPPVAAHAQDGSGGQGSPTGQQQDPDDPGGPGNDDDDDDDGSNSPEEEGSEPVFLTTSVSPARVPITSGTATVTWEADNARYCTVDGVARATFGKITVGPWTTTGAKSILIECYNNGKAGYAADSVTVTVYGVPKPVITTTLPNVTLMEPHFWDWRANVREGAKYMDETYTAARNSLIYIRNLANSDSNPMNDWPEGSWDPEKDKGEEGSLARENIWNDVFSRYNTGSHLYAPSGNGGEINCAPKRPAPKGKEPKIMTKT